MKKKIIIVLIVIVCLAAVIFVAGRNSDNGEKPNNSVSIGEIINPTGDKDKNEEKETEKETEIQKKDPDKIVEFEIPVLFLEEKYQNNLGALARDKGYESATFSRNKKTVKIKLKALSYDLYLAQTGIATIRAICETFESKEYPYVKDLGEYEDDFSYVTLLVSGKKFKKADNVDLLFARVSNCCAYYLLQDNDSPNEYKIDICDEKTGKLLATKSFNKKDFLG